MFSLAASLAIPTGLLLLILIVGCLIFLFEIWMFVSTIRNNRISTDRKLLWLLGMLLIHPFVAIAYYFTDHTKSS